MKSFFIKIITPERTLYEGDIFSATLPTHDGEVTILADHIPYIVPLKAGTAVLKTKNGEELFAIAGGFIEFSHNTLSVLADTAERAVEIDLARVEEARKKAEALMAERERMDEAEYALVVATLERELAREKVARKYQLRNR